MPSSRDPSVVQPGPGKLAAGQVQASAIAFPIGGSGDLAAHINDPIDAHMSGAIGIPETSPVTGLPLLSSAGGPYDGESVLDALVSLSDLIPPRPDRLGFNASGVPNSGIPNWTNALTVGGGGTAIHGGWTDGSTGIITKYLCPIGSVGAKVVEAVTYPADRGVLAVYRTTAGNFFNAGQTTLLMALWLGSNPAPAGIPSANFSEATRPSGQTDYTPANSGLDRITLIDRLPYATNYPGLEYTPFGSNFSSFQLAKAQFTITLASGDNESYLIVHWRQSYATTLAAIQPASLTVGTLITANCYSAVPSDTAEYENNHRKQVYVDPDSAVVVGPTSITTAVSGSPSTHTLSGVLHYGNGPISFNITATAVNLFYSSYYTNSTASASVPVGFESTVTPVQVDVTDFGSTIANVPLYDASPAHIVDDGTGLGFTLGSPPSTSAVARYQDSAFAATYASLAEPVWPQATIRLRWQATFSGMVTQTSTQSYLFVNPAEEPSTETFESFNTETYRYISSYAASTPAVPVIPAGGNIYNSAALLASSDGNAQVVQGRIIYPQTDFSSGLLIRPATASANYFTVQGGDPGNHKRRYVRAFNTGIPRNTGRLRIIGLAFSAFDAGLNIIDPLEVSDHTGGAIVQIKVPGSTGWLDLGRANGVPDLNKAADFRGCRTGIVGDTYSFDTGSFTADNGSGKFLLFVRVTFIKGVAGLALSCRSIEWLPP